MRLVGLSNHSGWSGQVPPSFGTPITNHVRSPVVPGHRRRNAEPGRFLEDISEKHSMHSRRRRSKTSEAGTKPDAGRRGVGAAGSCGEDDGAMHRPGRPSRRARRWGSAGFRCCRCGPTWCFPQTVVPLVINRPSGIRLIDDVLVGERMVGLVSQLHPEIDEPGIDDLYPTVCVGLGPQDAQVPRRLDADRLPGAVPGPAGRRGADRAVPDRRGRAATRRWSRRASSSTPWCTTSTGSSSGWSTRASRSPRSCRSPR